MSEINEEIKEIIVKSTMIEICKDGKIDDIEKEILIELIKYLRYPKALINQLKKDILKETTIDKNLGTLDPDYLIWSIERKLKNLLDETSVLNLLKKIKPILFGHSDKSSISNNSLLNEDNTKVKKAPIYQVKQMPWEIDREERLRKEYDKNLKLEQEIKKLKQEEYLAGPVNLSIDGKNFEKYLSCRINPESITNFNVVMSFIKQGQYETALKFLFDYSNSFNYEYRYLLSARIYFELNQYKKANSYLEKAKTSGLCENIYAREHYIFHCNKEYNEKKWQEILKKQSTSTNISKDKSLNALLDDLVSRGKSNIALLILENLNLQNDSDYILSKKKFSQIKNIFYKDIYYGYYGPFILILQILIAILILGICIFNRDYYYFAIQNLLQSIVAGIPDYDLFILSLNRVGPYSFLLIALAPLLLVNCKIILSGLTKQINSSIQVFDNYIRITSFNKVYHINYQDPKKTFFLYEDDTDFSYISLVRHLPFIPNYTYVYAYDELRKIYVLLPLYGIADGYFFIRNHLSKGKGYTSNINMIGVRFAQMASVIGQINQSFLALTPILLGSILFFYSNLTYISEVNFQSFSLMFLSYSLSIALYFTYPSLFLKWMRHQILSKPLKINVIKPGIVVLSIWYFTMRYYPYGVSSLIPIISCSTIFYLVFVRSKYFGDTKQIVAELTSFESTQSISQNAIGLNCLNLGKSQTLISKEVKLFFNEEYVALERRFLGFILYYDVIKRTSKFMIQVLEQNNFSIIRIGNFNYHIKSKSKDIISMCKEAKLTFTSVKSVNKSKSKIHIIGVLTSFSLFLSWQSYYYLQVDKINGENLILNNQSYKIATKYFNKKNNDIIHTLENQKYSYKNLQNKRVIQYHQSRSMTWGELENTIRVGLSEKNKEQFDTPIYIKKDGYREDVWVFMFWHFYKKYQSIDHLRYSQTMKSYCHDVGMSAISIGHNIRCAISFDYDTIIKNVLKNKKVPNFIPTKLLASLTSENGLLLEFANIKDQSDFDVVLKAVQNNGLSLQFASEKLQSNITIIEAAIQNNFKSSKFMNKKFWKNKKIVHKIVKKDGLLLQFADSQLKNNKQIVLSALSSNYLSYKTMNPILFDDFDIAKILLKNDGLLIKKLNKQQRKSKDLVKVAILQNGLSLKFCDDLFHGDPQIVSMAIKSKLDVTKIMKQKLWENKTVLISILKKDGLLLSKVTKKLKKDRNIVLAAIQQNYRASIYMNQSFFEDETISEIILKKNGLFLEKVHSKLTKNKNLVKIAVASNGRAFQFVDPLFYKDKKLILLSYKTYRDSIKLIDKSLQKDFNFFKRLVKIDIRALQKSKLNIEKLSYKSNHQDKEAQVMLAYLFEYGIGVKPDYQKAKELYTKSLTFGNLQAATQLSRLYTKINPSSPLIWDYLNQAAKQSYLPAMLEFAKFHDQREGKLQDDTLARNYYLRSKDAKSSEGSYQLARFQEYAYGGKKDLKNALKNYLFAYQKSHEKAAMHLGLSYLFGHGVTIDKQKSFFYFLDGSKNQDHWAMFFLAFCYENGIGIKLNHQKSKIWYKQAYKLNNPVALSFLNSSVKDSIIPRNQSLKSWIDKGVHLQLERLIYLKATFLHFGLFNYDLDINQSQKLYQQLSFNDAKLHLITLNFNSKKISEKEYIEALYILSLKSDSAKTTYANIIFSKKKYQSEYQKAFKLLKQAAKNNYLLAMTPLAISYERGKGTEIDYKKSLKWFTKAAYFNQTNAKLNLGRVYEFGKGIKKDLHKAKYWYEQASFNDHPKAISSLTFLYETGF